MQTGAAADEFLFWIDYDSFAFGAVPRWKASALHLNLGGPWLLLECGTLASILNLGMLISR